MACGNIPAALFTQVPPESRLHVWVEGNPNDFIATAIVNGAPPPVSHSQLSAPGIDLPINDQVSVSVKLVFTSVTPGKAQVKARVIRRDGTILPSPFCCEFSAAHGAVRFCPIVAMTATAAESGEENASAAAKS